MANLDDGGVINPSEALSVDPVADGGEWWFNAVANKVFGNSLILERICSYVRSEADLHNYRLVNHSFHKEATRRLRRVHKEIVVDSDSRFRSMIKLATNRCTLKLTPFPFTSFLVDITPSTSLETVEAFGALVGPHISHLFSSLKEVHSTNKLVTLLSHSRDLVQLQLFSNLELLITKDDVDLLPSVFNSLITLAISAASSVLQTGTETETSFPLFDALSIRAPKLKNIFMDKY